VCAYRSLHFPPWTIADANEVMHQRKEDREAVAALAACPALSAGWCNALAVRAANSGSENPSRSEDLRREEA
jgi:hypothetical protein